MNRTQVSTKNSLQWGSIELKVKYGWMFQVLSYAGDGGIRLLTAYAFCLFDQRTGYQNHSVSLNEGFSYL